MRIRDLLDRAEPSFSFEFFPPKTDEAASALFETIGRLAELEPAYVSVTYGAGGSTRGRTRALVRRIKRDLGIEAMAHLTCVGHSVAELTEIARDLEAAGIENVLALRGDPPRGSDGFRPAPDGLAYAVELVDLLRRETSLCIGVAGYPETHIESPDRATDRRHFRDKVAAGADFAITQLFFDPADYFAFVAEVRALGVDVPIVPGIMPVTNLGQLKRFTSFCGATIPPDLLARLEGARDGSEVIEIGIDHAIGQCRRLLDGGAPGLHFYTLNRSRATWAILDALRTGGGG